MKENISQQLMNEHEIRVLRKTLEVICGKWRLFILLHLNDQTRRYGELRKSIPDVSEKVLIQELKALIEIGVVEKQSYNEVPPRVEYRLTQKGLTVLPQLLKLRDIGEIFMN